MCRFHAKKVANNVEGRESRFFAIVLSSQNDYVITCWFWRDLVLRVIIFFHPTYTDKPSLFSVFYYCILRACALSQSEACLARGEIFLGSSRITRRHRHLYF